MTLSVQFELAGAAQPSAPLGLQNHRQLQLTGSHVLCTAEVSQIAPVPIWPRFGYSES